MSLLSNAAGAVVLAKGVTSGTFAGPPIVLFARGMTSTTDPRWTATAAFADAIGAPYGRQAPLIGIDPTTDITNPPFPVDLSMLISALLDSNYLTQFAAAHEAPLPWADGIGIRFLPVSGPFFSIPQSATDFITSPTAWDTSAQFIRLAAANMYGIGCMACGSAEPEVQLSPPVYQFPWDTYASRFPNLQNVWRRGGPVAASNYSALQTAESVSGRNGVSRRTHPALTPYVYLQSP